MQIKDITSKKCGKVYTITGTISNMVFHPLVIDPTKFLTTFDVSDNTGKIEAIVMPKNIEVFNKLFYDKIITNGMLVKIKGTVKYDSKRGFGIIVKTCKKFNCQN